MHFHPIQQQIAYLLQRLRINLTQRRTNTFLYTDKRNIFDSTRSIAITMQLCRMKWLKR